jgi:hypothetical protein
MLTRATHVSACEDNYGGKKIPIAVSSDAQGCGETVGVTRLARQEAVWRR